MVVVVLLFGLLWEWISFFFLFYVLISTHLYLQPVARLKLMSTEFFQDNWKKLFAFAFFLLFFSFFLETFKFLEIKPVYYKHDGPFTLDELG